MERKGKIILIAAVSLFVLGGLGAGTYLFLRMDNDSNPQSKETLSSEKLFSTAFKQGLNNLEENGDLTVTFQPNDLNAYANYCIKEQLNENFSVVPYSFKAGDYTVNNFYFETVNKKLQAVACVEKGILKTIERADAKITFSKEGVEFYISDVWKEGRGSFSTDFSPKMNLSFDFRDENIKKILSYSEICENFSKNLVHGAKYNLSKLMSLEERYTVIPTSLPNPLATHMLDSYNDSTHTMEMTLEDINHYLRTKMADKFSTENVCQLGTESVELKSENVFWNADLESKDAGTLEFKASIGSLKTFFEFETTVEFRPRALKFTFSSGTLNGKNVGEIPSFFSEKMYNETFSIVYSEISPELNNFEFSGGQMFAGRILLNAQRIY